MLSHVSLTTTQLYTHVVSVSLKTSTGTHPGRVIVAGQHAQGYRRRSESASAALLALLGDELRKTTIAPAALAERSMPCSLAAVCSQFSIRIDISQPRPVGPFSAVYAPQADMRKCKSSIKTARMQSKTRIRGLCSFK